MIVVDVIVVDVIVVDVNAAVRDANQYAPFCSAVARAMIAVSGPCELSCVLGAEDTSAIRSILARAGRTSHLTAKGRVAVNPQVTEFFTPPERTPPLENKLPPALSDAMADAREACSRIIDAMPPMEPEVAARLKADLTDLSEQFALLAKIASARVKP